MAEVKKRQWGLSGYEKQWSAFFERHVGGTLHQGPTRAVGHRRNGSHGAGADDHAGTRSRSRRRNRTTVVVIVGCNGRPIPTRGFDQLFLRTDSRLRG
jgi:hypothetical protein